MKSCWAALCALLALAFAGCGERGGGDGATVLPPGTPVVLVSIDTLRADHLPAYGYESVATPAIDALRRDGILFQHAYAITPLTLPSHATLLSGVLPAVHGVRDNVGYKLDAAKIRSGELPFLPQLLAQAGYATGGAVSAYVLQGRSGIGTGFDTYDDGIEYQTGLGLGGLQRPGGETLRNATAWLAGVKERPFFLFLHLYEPHTPYQPPEPYASRYSSKYDGEIAAADQIVGELVAELERLDLYDRALVILLADHGEGLGDHEEEEHGVLLYREAIQVPLLLKLPGSRRAGATVSRPVQLLDVAPTVLSLLGKEVPKAMSGVSLLAENVPARRIYAETFYPRIHFGWSELFSLIDERHHYIDSPEPELYDHASDPGERRNLLRDERRVYAALRQELATYERDLAPPAAVDEETRKAMAALGYVSSGAGPSEGPLPSPRSKIGTLADLRQGTRLFSTKDFRGAEAAFQRVLAENPKMVDAWEFLGRALQRQGRSGEALAALRRGLEISQGSPELAVSAASIYYELGQLDEAETHAKMALVAHSSFAHGLLAQIALQRERLEEAEREARAALTDQSQRIGPLIVLAEVLHARGRDDEALQALAQAAEVYEQRQAKDPDLLRGFELIRGKVLADRGDAAGAEAAFRREIERFPDALRGYSSLAILYALSGRGPEVGPTLRQMVDTNPTPPAYAEAVKALRVVKDPVSASALLRHALARFPRDPALRALASG